MSERGQTGNTSNSRFIPEPRKRVHRAFIDPAALGSWLVPGDMSATIRDVEVRVGGGYSMTLRYPDAGQQNRGKSSDHEDRYTARFVEFTPPSRLVAAITFDTADPDFAGEMLITVTLAESDGGTMVTIAFENIPPGIRTEDN